MGLQSPCPVRKNKELLHHQNTVEWRANRDDWPFTVANNFWGKDDAGVGPLLERMHAAKQTNDELRAFYAGQ